MSSRHQSNSATSVDESSRKRSRHEMSDSENDSFDDDPPGTIPMNAKRGKACSPLPTTSTPQKRLPKIVLDERDLSRNISPIKTEITHSTPLDDSFDADPFIQCSSDRSAKKETGLTPLKELDTNKKNLFNQVLSPAKKKTSSTLCQILDDSFDEPVSISAPRLADSPKHKPAPSKSSGVPGFPSLCDPALTVLLTVKEVRHADYSMELTCTADNERESIVYLHGQWSSSKMDAGTKIRLIDAQRWGESDWLVSDESGVLVVDPDTLVPCTAIAGASWCARKVVLNDRFKAGCEANKAMLIGCIMHELFQVAVQSGDPSSVTHEWILAHWRSNISGSVMESLAALNFTPAAFEGELKPYADVIVTWIHTHLPNKTRILQVPVPLPSGSSISTVHDIEENIWEPLIGVKGKIDASLQTKRKGDSVSLIEPLELKTGKSGQSFEHAGQVLLYCMMLSVRYDEPITSGSLLYLKDGVTRPVQPKPLEMKGILQLRNSLAYYLGKISGQLLPEPKTDPHFCGKCEQALTCSIYQQHLETGGNVSEKFRDFAKEQIAHLTSDSLAYFERWMNMVYREWNSDRKSKNGRLSDLWNVEPDLRESNGRCASEMTFASCEKTADGGSVVLRFERGAPIKEGVFTAGNMCTVSSSDVAGIVLSFIVDSDCNSISVRCERKFRLLRLGAKYHIDIYDSYSTYATTLGNILMLMMPDEINTRHRSLIVDLCAPVVAPSIETDLPHTVIWILNKAGLNQGQRTAVVAAITAVDYSLIEGLPGSGKTTTIAVLVRCLVAMGRSVLLTSFTNSAVDNILLKLLKDLPPRDLLRLGKQTSFKENVRPLSMQAKLDGMGPDIDQYKETRNILKNTAVVACTCHHTSREVLFSWRRFDVCIVDEASMVVEPIILSALATSSRFVLVGDRRQLAPLVLDKQSREDGMNISLFERLAVHTSALTSLESQFRMNSVIAKIPSSLFYENRLICASSSVSNGTLKMIDGYKEVTTNNDALDLALSGDMDNSCVFVDTSAASRSCTASQQRRCGPVRNEQEARVVAELVRHFQQSGVPSSDIGVMCVYRKQVDVIANILGPSCSAVEVNTVDQYQGRDKAVIIWSLVWTEQTGRRCELLEDDRRVNVALTRAKHKMVVVGCGQSMETIAVMHKAVHRMKRVQWTGTL